MKVIRAVATALAAAALVLSAPVHAQDPKAVPNVAQPKLRSLAIAERKWTGDFDGMLERRIIRIAIPYSRTLYYNDKGRERGITAENARDFERWINQKYSKQLGKRPLTVYIIPTTRDDLMPDVTGGVADIAAGNITVTEQRLKLVDFVAPEDQRPVTEVVVSRATAPVATAEDLSGRTVHVRPSSSYFNSLEALNAKLKKAGKPPAKLVQVPDELEDEDMMEMLNAGVIENIVVDDWKAKVWAQILPNLKVNEGAVVREGGKVGWAVRKDSPKLQAEILAFWKDYLKKQGVAEYRMKQAMSRVKQMKNNATDAEYKKFIATVELFQKYGPKYGFDPIMLAAQGYQESTLNQNAKSHVGAIGVMQIMPATGAELKVGDITKLEPNIHGGAKYMDKLMTQYFKDANFSESNRALFAFASYNCGPGNVSKMRKEAEKRGLDPDKWFNNVELVTAEKIGVETTTYVRNIYKYYVSYKLTYESKQAAIKARESVTGAPAK
jgi:membrane-bound lytic murein transglycosylase MltF